jgi:hypothetical protein
MNRWPVVLLPLLAAAPALAQSKDALEIVPKNALGFILVKDLSQLSAKMERMAKRLDAKMHVSLLEHIKKEAGVKKGLDEKGSALFIVLGGEKEKQPDVSLALPVTDHAEVFAQLGIKDAKGKVHEGEIEPADLTTLAGVGDGPGGKERDPSKRPKVKVAVAKRDQFVLLTLPAHKGALERVVEARESIVGTLKPAREWLGEQDIAGVCTQDGVKVGLGLFVGNPYLAAGSTSPEQAELMKETFAEAEKNIQFVAFGGHISDEGHSSLRTRAYFTPKGSYAEWMARAKPIEGDLLSRLPGRDYQSAFLAQVSSQINLRGVRHLLRWLPSDKAKGLSEEALRLMEKVSDVGVVTYAADSPDKKPGTAGTVVLARVKDAPAFVKDASALLARAQDAAHAESKDEEGGKPKELRVGGKPAAILKVRPVPLPEGKDFGPLKVKGKDKPDKRSLLFVALSEDTVLVGDLAEGEKPESVVERAKSEAGTGLAADEQLKKTMALLPGKLQIALYVNAKNIAKAYAPDVPFPDAPPLALAMRTFDAGVETQFVVPFETVKGFFEMGRRGREKEREKK